LSQFCPIPKKTPTINRNNCQIFNHNITDTKRGYFLWLSKQVHSVELN
jgi:hypothetical protein